MIGRARDVIRKERRMRRLSSRGLGRRAPLRALGIVLLLSACAAPAPSQTAGPTAPVAVTRGQFDVKLDAGAIVSLRPASRR